MKKQNGFSVANGIGIIMLIALGSLAGGAIFKIIGAETFTSNVRFMAMLFGIFLAPLWALYSDLKKLKDHDRITKKQAREIDHRVGSGLHRLSYMFVFFVLSAVLVASAGLWPTDPGVTEWFARLVGAVLFLSCAFVVNIVLNMKELSRFETRLVRKKQEKAASDELLQKLRKQNGNNCTSHNPG